MKKHSIVIMVFAIFTLCVGIWSAIIDYENPHWETITVNEKNINPGEKSEKWLVYTDDEVYCVTDLIFVGFFTSSDVYNSMKVGETYEVYVSGRRVPYLSKYKIIREVAVN